MKVVAAASCVGGVAAGGAALPQAVKVRVVASTRARVSCFFIVPSPF